MHVCMLVRHRHLECGDKQQPAVHGCFRCDGAARTEEKKPRIACCTLHPLSAQMRQDQRHGPVFAPEASALADGRPSASSPPLGTTGYQKKKSPKPQTPPPFLGWFGLHGQKALSSVDASSHGAPWPGGASAMLRLWRACVPRPRWNQPFQKGR